MKRQFLLLLSLCFYGAFGQIPAYYNSVDFGLTELALKEELSDLITTTHTSPTSYSEVWDVLKVSDLDPTNSSVVLLIYGYNDGDGDVTNDRTRDKNDNGGSPGEWNREHVYPKSLGAPDLGTSGPGSDPHNLRASDVQMNGNRSNRMYADASGNAGTVGSNWYPGDEWKGDAARILMYMYLRYGNRCLPTAVAVGSTNAIDPNMVNILLEWNAEDPVSQHERDRNDAIHDAIGNRNPFIDNPHIANHIWGGMEAEDTWGNLSNEEEYLNDFSLYPNPANGNIIQIRNIPTSITFITLTAINGELVYTFNPSQNLTNLEVSIADFEKGIYFVSLHSNMGVKTKKLIIQ